MEVKDLKYLNTVFKVNLFSCEASKGNVLIAPAMGITAKYYIQFAIWLSEQGFTVMILDYLDTGLSANEEIKNSKTTLNDWVKNIEIAGQELKRSNPSIPLIYLGHSIGSQLFGFIENIKLFDKVVFIASSTGYWKDGRSPQKWMNYFLLNVVMPLSNLVWGYTNAKLFKQGENYPKNVSLQWRKWCMNKEYLKMELNDNQTNNYNLFKGKITSIWFSDDPIANEITAQKLVSIYKSAETLLIEINPTDFNSTGIGHTGFLSRKYKGTLWNRILEQLIA